MCNYFKKSVANRELLFWLGIPKEKFETRQAKLTYVVAIIYSEVSRSTENGTIHAELKQTRLPTVHISLYQIWICL